MAATNINTILQRVSVATPESPIAVFRIGNNLHSTFGSTVRTQEWIIAGKPELIGLFHRGIPIKTITMMLQAARGE